MVFYLKLVGKGTLIVLALFCGVNSLEFDGSNSSTLTSAESDLVFVSVLFRHGDRTPIWLFPNNPYNNMSYWPEGLGKLTNKGKQREYNLGNWLRSRYDSFLAQQYSPDTLYVESTDYDRTLMSAQCVVAGMYPPKGRQKWNPNLNWQPIPIHTIPVPQDKKSGEAVWFESCPAYTRDYEKLLESQEIKELKSKFSDVFSVLNNNTGNNISCINDVYRIFDTLNVEKLNNLVLPDWAETGNIYQRIGEASNYYFVLPTWTPKLSQLRSGLLVKDIVSHMTQKAGKSVSKERLPKMWMYSGHDTTISSLLNSLKVFDLQFPPYSSAVLVELRKNAEGNHFVMLFYRNSTIHEPYLLTLPGCTSMCPLDNFVELVTPLIPEDWDKQCE